MNPLTASGSAPLYTHRLHMAGDLLQHYIVNFPAIHAASRRLQLTVVYINDQAVLMLVLLMVWLIKRLSADFKNKVEVIWPPSLVIIFLKIQVNLS